MRALGEIYGRVRVMGLAYAVGSQRFRPWNSGMDLALCTSNRAGITCCHFYFFLVFRRRSNGVSLSFSFSRSL